MLLLLLLLLLQLCGFRSTAGQKHFLFTPAPPTSCSGHLSAWRQLAVYAAMARLLATVGLLLLSASVGNAQFCHRKKGCAKPLKTPKETSAASQEAPETKHADRAAAVGTARLKGASQHSGAAAATLKLRAAPLGPPCGLG